METTVCGIELAGSEARIVTLSGTKSKFEDVSGAFKKISLDDSSSQDMVKSLMGAIHHHFKTAGVTRVAVNARNAKGDHAGGAVSFKFEALIQVAEPKVVLVHPSTLKAFLNKRPLPADVRIPFKYLNTAYQLAYYLLDEGDDHA